MGPQSSRRGRAVESHIFVCCADNQVAIAEACGIPPLVALVRDGTDAQKAAAAMQRADVKNLAFNADNKVAWRSQRPRKNIRKAVEWACLRELHSRRVPFQIYLWMNPS